MGGWGQVAPGPGLWGAQKGEAPKKVHENLKKMEKISLQLIGGGGAALSGPRKGYAQPIIIVKNVVPPPPSRRPCMEQTNFPQIPS